MRHLCQLVLLLSLLVLPRLGFGQCAGEFDAVHALRDARHARGVLSDLGLMRAWDRQLHHEMSQLKQLDPDETQDTSTALLYWSDSFDGYRVCGSSENVSLDRKWWGARGDFLDLRYGIGIELFYLASTDSLGFKGDLEDFNYGWRHRVAGARLGYRDWVAFELGTIDIEAPSRNGEGLHDGSAYFALSSPFLGVGSDLIVHPDTRRMDMLRLGLQRTPLPWLDLSIAAHGGWLQDESKGLFGFGLTGFEDAVSMDIVFEGTPVRVRSASVRLENIARTQEDFSEWAEIGFAPFLEVSMFNSARFEEATGRQYVPGAAVGVLHYITTSWCTMGVEAFAGVNRASELNRLSPVVDHLHWGARLYLSTSI